jgi:glycine cleavage system H protein
MYPETYKYTNDHEWIELASGRVGITDFAQKQLGDIVFLDLPEVGRQLKKGDQLGTVESVKAVSEVFAPVSGTVVEVNKALAEKPEGINQDAHGSWFVVLKPADASEGQALLDAAQYSELTK